MMEIGDTIFLPKSVDGGSPSTTTVNPSFFNEKELEFVHSLELYKVLGSKNCSWSFMWLQYFYSVIMLAMVV